RARPVHRQPDPPDAGTKHLGTHLASNGPFMQDEVRDTGVRMLDGSQWLVERVTGHDYKIVERANPNEGPIYTTGMAMLRLTGWKFGKIY
ncbi:hypothetical protein, partial [Sphingomonas sp. Leaf62]|uniref:hypothetical protein n=1 Tax=Sphingomonas sp. Leaf62 TaxID=1736228 RepID=UPI000AC8ECF3